MLIRIFYAFILFHSLFAQGILLKDSTVIKVDSLWFNNENIILLDGSDTIIKPLDSLSLVYHSQFNDSIFSSAQVYWDTVSIEWQKNKSQDFFFRHKPQYTDSLQLDLKTVDVCWVSLKPVNYQTNYGSFHSVGSACLVLSEKKWKFQILRGSGYYQMKGKSLKTILSEGDQLVKESELPVLIQESQDTDKQRWTDQYASIQWNEKTLKKRSLIHDLYSGRFIAAVVVYTGFAVLMGVADDL